jgi:hypothetical protein
MASVDSREHPATQSARFNAAKLELAVGPRFGYRSDRQLDLGKRIARAKRGRSSKMRTACLVLLADLGKPR